jgi:hypothetical protein
MVIKSQPTDVNNEPGKVASSRTSTNSGIIHKRVAISCVTFDTIKISEPIRELRADKAYLFHYDKALKENPLSKPAIYTKFYLTVVDQLHNLGFKDDDIIDINTPVYKFSEVLSSLIKIMTEEREAGNDVYVNISAGTSEFAAAATVAAMMVEGVSAYTVNARDYTITGEDRLMELYSDNGILYGHTKATWPLREMPIFNMRPPPRDLVVGLRALNNVLEGCKSSGKSVRKAISYANMIRAIRGAGAWTYEPDDERKKPSNPDSNEKPTSSEKMYYSRHYIDGWVKRGWVKGERQGLTITKSGRNTIDIFYRD